MSTHFINIIATSNVAPVLAGDTVAAEANASAHGKVARAELEEAAATTVSSSTTKKKTKDTIAGAFAQQQYGKAVSMSTLKLLGLDVAQKQVGYNMLGMSIRVGAWFVPTMLIMATSMLPVIAGLLAIASAAVVATGGIAGLAAIGLWKKSKEQSASGGFAGARRPYGGAGEQMSFISTLMQPIADVMNDPTFTRQITLATDFITDTFGKTIPAAFRAFLNNVDMGVMEWLTDLFTTWLPKAAASLANWGSVLLKTIGGKSLSAVNNFFKYLAGGLQNIAEWLEATKFSQLETLTSILSEAIHELMILGTSALPTLVHVLKQLWPFPLKPMIEGLSKLFQAMSESPAALKMITGLVQLFTVLAGFKVLGMVLGTVATAMPYIIAGATAIGGVLAGIGLIPILIGLAIVSVLVILWHFRDTIIDIFQEIANVIAAALWYPIDRLLGKTGEGTFGEYRDARFERTADKGYFHDTDFSSMAAGRFGKQSGTFVDMTFKIDEGIIAESVNGTLVSEGTGTSFTKSGYFTAGRV